MATIITRIFQYEDRRETKVMWRCIHCNKTMTLPERFDFAYCGKCGGKVLERLNIKEEF